MTTKNAAQTVEVRGEPLDVEHLTGSSIEPPTVVESITTAAPDAITHLRDAGREPMRLWRVKAPKDVGGTIEAILCQDDNTVLLAQSKASGRFVLYVKEPSRQSAAG